MSFDLVAIRRDLHRHPEIAFQERRTAAVITRHLVALELAARQVAGTGVVAEIAGAHAGPTIALRADMDALPLEEQTGLPYASTVAGCMHACGHDAHAAILLGAAELLVSARERLHGTVRLLFQPAEETTTGARAMVQSGALEGTDAIFGLHNDPRLPVGVAAFRAGKLMAASDRISVHIIGKGGHAAMPHLAIDPIVAGATVVMGLQTAVSRVMNPLDPLVVTIAQFSGGTTFNVIAERVVLEGTVRYFSPTVGEGLPGVLQTLVNGLTAGHRCRAELLYQRMVPPVDNDERLTSLAREVAATALGAASVQEAQPTMGAEDFAVYQGLVPGCFLSLGSAGPHGLHHPAFTIDEGCLPVGARLLAELALAAAAAR